MECRDVGMSLLNRYASSNDRAIILEALESIDFPASRRKNVRRASQEGDVLGMCLGMTECWFRGPMPSRHTRERPNLCRLLCDFARRELPGFHFTSIQVNKDYAAELHVDKKDAGDSRIIGLGPYRGGQLWVDDGSHAGKGRVADIRGRWLGFDGNLPHKVLPFEGRRYTLVFFSKLRGWSVGLQPESPHATALFSLGFPLPTRQPHLKDFLPGEERLKRARARYEDFCAHTLRRGGAGKRVRLEVGSQAREMSTASPMCKLKPSGDASFAQLGLGSLPLLPADCLARLGICNKKVCCDMMGEPCTPKRRRLGPQPADSPPKVFHQRPHGEASTDLTQSPHDPLLKESVLAATQVYWFVHG